jgi:hypothetical protein
MEGKDLEALTKDIREHGLREPITLHPDGSILDGRNRYRACLHAGVEPQFVTWQDDGSPISFVISLNLKRRQLTASQRAMIALKAKSLLAAEAKERQVRANPRGVQEGGVLVPPGTKGRANTLAGALVGISGMTVARAQRIAKRGVPELVAAVRAGEITVRAAAEIAMLPEAEQRAALAGGPEAIRRARLQRPGRKEPKPKVAKKKALDGVKRLPRQKDEDVFRRGIQALEGLCLGLAKCNTEEVLKACDGKQLRNSLRKALQMLRRIYAGMGGNGEPNT